MKIPTVLMQIYYYYYRFIRLKVGYVQFQVRNHLFSPELWNVLEKRKWGWFRTQNIWELKLLICRLILSSYSVVAYQQHKFVLVNPITNIINTLLFLGVFPRSTKAALVKPLIKKHSMDCNILNNYIHLLLSNLTFLSKVIESAVAFIL